MANSLTNILDKILARNLRILRESAVMPRLTNIDYQGAAAQKGTTIDVPIPAAQTVADVTAAPTHSSAASATPGLIQVPMDQWKHTDFFLTDKEMTEIDSNRHFVPGQMEKATVAIANNIDQYIHNLYPPVYGYVGTAAVTPFSTVATSTEARRILNTQLAPMDGRSVVLDPTAEAQALQLTAFSDVEKSADRDVKIKGELGEKFGMTHFMSQNVQTHTAGTAASVLVASTTAAGSSTIGLTAGDGGGTLLVGDIFTIAGDTQTYAVTASASLSSTAVAVSIKPGLAAIASSAAVATRKATHVVNMGFTRDAFVYVTRPLAQSVVSQLRGANPMSIIQDPMTGLTLRLEVVRQYKQDSFDLDVLYGGKCVLPEAAVRIAG